MINRLHIYIGIIVYIFSFKALNAQDLLKQLQSEEIEKTEKVASTFKMLKIGLGHSVETRKEGVLEISSYTRFWNIPEVDGEVIENDNFGADRANARFGVDYAIKDNLSAGFGWANTGVIDGYLKYRIAYQERGIKASPLSLTFLAGIAHRSKNINNVVLNEDSVSVYSQEAEKTSINKTSSFNDKTNYIGQLLVARKINRNLSLQLSPTLVYRGSTRFDVDNKLHLALGMGARYVLGKHVSLASEYFYLPKKYQLNSIDTFGAFSLGVNWEVSKVQVQMFLSNTGNYSEDLFITETPVNFNTKDGNLFFGLNFSYVIHFKKNK